MIIKLCQWAIFVREILPSIKKSPHQKCEPSPSGPKGRTENIPLSPASFLAGWDGPPERPIKSNNDATYGAINFCPFS